MQKKLIPIDLHCHSIYSDGAYSVEQLLNLAHENGGKHIALTDHDTVDGISEAKKHAKTLGLNLISGVEISVTWENNILIHILGLNINETDIALQKNLKTLRLQRFSRGEKIAENLAKTGIKGALEGALKYCSIKEALSRTHFAKFLVDSGYAKPGKVFDKFLAKGKPGYAPIKWASLEDAVTWINNSGGIAVIAHPGRYKFTRTKLLNLISQFKELGGKGIEVVCSSHSLSDIDYIASIAVNQNLLASMGSDFHSNESFRKISVGVNPPIPERCIPIYSALGISEI
ncbi:MAG TPA: PHP domain-containing protein [Burkholderiales bacterium]|nr:PHP domain-containing protein [Burkholderiales bacterium]